MSAERFQELAGKLAKTLRVMLIADQPGEVMAARAALGRILVSAGYDMHTFADLIESGSIVDADTVRAMQNVLDEANVRAMQAEEVARAAVISKSVRPTASLHDIAIYCRDHGVFKSERERGFVTDMTLRTHGDGEISESQEGWLRKIWVRSMRANGHEV